MMFVDEHDRQEADRQYHASAVTKSSDMPHCIGLKERTMKAMRVLRILKTADHMTL